MLNTYDEIGIADEYRECITQLRERDRRWAGRLERQRESARASCSGGLPAAPRQRLPPAPPGPAWLGPLLESVLSSGDLSSITGLLGGSAGWLDIDRMKASASYYEQNRFDASALVITEKNGQRVIALSEEQWKLVQEIEQNVFVDDGEGFIDLGLDNAYEYNTDGDLIMEYDGTWLALNGHIVSYYMVSDDRHGDTYSIKGRIPAMLNGRLVDIIVVFDDQNPYGVVLGAQINTIPRLRPRPWPRVSWTSWPATRSTISVTTTPMPARTTTPTTWATSTPPPANGRIENLPVGDSGYQMTYRLTDIYGNKYWTPSISD